MVKFYINIKFPWLEKKFDESFKLSASCGLKICVNYSVWRLREIEIEY